MSGRNITTGQALPALRSVFGFFAVIFTISWGAIAMAQTKTEVETRNKAIVQGRFDAWGNLGVRELFCYGDTRRQSYQRVGTFSAEKVV